MGEGIPTGFCLPNVQYILENTCEKNTEHYSNIYFIFTGHKKVLLNVLSLTCFDFASCYH